jgi:hypothetical protein
LVRPRKIPTPIIGTGASHLIEERHAVLVIARMIDRLRHYGPEASQLDDVFVAIGHKLVLEPWHQDQGWMILGIQKPSIHPWT